MTTTVLNTNINGVENKILNISSLVNTTVLNTKLREVENKVNVDSKYFKSEEFNKLAAETFAARLKQGDLVNKTYFDNKLKSFNKGTTSNKTKHLEVQNELNSLRTNDYIFFFGRMYFISNDGPQNAFVYHQPTLDTLELTQDKGKYYVVS